MLSVCLLFSLLLLGVIQKGHSAGSAKIDGKQKLPRRCGSQWIASCLCTLVLNYLLGCISNGVCLHAYT